MVSANGGADVLLALDAGVRESGWAVFTGGEVAASGVVSMKTRRKLEPGVRIGHLLESLEVLANQYRPRELVHCQPTGINWKVPALELLDSELARWSAALELPTRAYTAQEVRSAIAGHPNASRDQLGYAIMLLLGLIGQGRTTHEWEAIAVGHYHLSRREAANP